MKSKKFINIEAIDDIFHNISVKISHLIGNAWVFVLMFLIILIWLLMGPIFKYSDTWQLVINTATSVITFLIVFVIQNTQIRETKAVQLKLDELIRANKLAHNTIIDLDSMSESGIKELEMHYKRISEQKDDPIENDAEK